jgi:hypothetical protein
VQKIEGSRRFARLIGVGILAGSVILGVTSTASTADEAPITDTPAETPQPSAPAESQDEAAPEEEPDGGVTAQSQPAGTRPPYGEDFPVQVETNFARPAKAISSAANSDFSQLNDLERLIRGSYKTPSGSLRTDRKNNWVKISISRMEDSKRVGRTLIEAAKYGVNVRVIHGKAAQSKASRALAKSLGKYKNAKFKICAKGSSLACLSSARGAYAHSKILTVSSTYTRDNELAKGVIWTGSANLGGPSAERTWNNGWTVYNDAKLSLQMDALWGDMWNERNVGNDYPRYVRKYHWRYGMYPENAIKYGYVGTTEKAAGYAMGGMFYSNLANTTFYETPISASPTNGRDPVMNMLNRIIPDDRCAIRLQENRFKYRRIAVAQKLVELSNAGCQVSAISFKDDDNKANYTAHCQSGIRICRPILDVFRTAARRIEVAYAKPHDKTMLVEGKLKPNGWNTDERLPNGDPWPKAGAYVKMVQGGSAALTGSNLVVSDEITSESTNPEVYEDYLEHYKAIWKSREYKAWNY